MSDLNKEAIRKWIEALRSGDYRQGYHKLRNYNKDEDDTFCCLGVACDVLKEDLEGEWNMKADDYKFKVLDDQSHGMEFMPDVVVEYLGLSEEFLNDTLSGLNDKERYTFEEIADRIERKVN